MKQETRKKKNGGKTSNARKAQLQAARASRGQHVSISTGPSSPATPGPSSPATPGPVSNSSAGSSEPPEIQLSASKRKLGYAYCGLVDDGESSSDKRLPCTICSLDCLSPLIEATLCPHCVLQTLKLIGDEKRNRGLAVCLIVYCESCCKEIKTVMTSNKSDTHIFDVNRHCSCLCNWDGSCWPDQLRRNHEYAHFAS